MKDFPKKKESTMQNAPPKPKAQAFQMILDAEENGAEDA